MTTRADRIRQLQEEYDELYRRTMGLHGFMYAPASPFEFVGEHMQSLVRQQHGVMLAYLDVLGQRIAAERLVNSYNGEVI